jgi:hypothetical protein
MFFYREPNDEIVKYAYKIINICYYEGWLASPDYIDYKKKNFHKY